MASILTIEKRWCSQIRREGESISKTFRAKAWRQTWARGRGAWKKRYEGGRLVSRGREQPKGSGVKTPVTARFDTDIVDAFKATGPGWQTRMNDALREWLKEHQPA